MNCFGKSCTCIVFLYLIYLSLHAKAHSWITQLWCECPQNSGFPRNYLPKSVINQKSNTPSFEERMTYKLPSYNKNESICSSLQKNSTQNRNFPRLKCPPGSIVHFDYASHNLATSKLKESKTFWSIHWSQQSLNMNGESKLECRRDINLGDGSTLYDENGEIIDTRQNNNMLAIEDFACSDGGAKNRNFETPRSCVGRFQLPHHIPPLATYKFVWYWISHSASMSIEEFTTCFDIDISDHRSRCPRKKTRDHRKPDAIDEVKPVERNSFNLSNSIQNGLCPTSHVDQKRGIISYKNLSCGPECASKNKSKNCLYCRSSVINQFNKHIHECPSHILAIHDICFDLNDGKPGIGSYKEPFCLSLDLIGCISTQSQCRKCRKGLINGSNRQLDPCPEKSMNSVNHKIVKGRGEKDKLCQKLVEPGFAKMYNSSSYYDLNCYLDESLLGCWKTKKKLFCRFCRLKGKSKNKFNQFLNECD